METTKRSCKNESSKLLQKTNLFDCRSINVDYILTRVFKSGTNEIILKNFECLITEQLRHFNSHGEFSDSVCQVSRSTFIEYGCAPKQHNSNTFRLYFIAVCEIRAIGLLQQMFIKF